MVDGAGGIDEGSDGTRVVETEDEFEVPHAARTPMLTTIATTTEEPRIHGNHARVRMDRL
jgi:hypothetical protein